MDPILLGTVLPTLALGAANGANDVSKGVATLAGAAAGAGVGEPAGVALGALGTVGAGAAAVAGGSVARGAVVAVGGTVGSADAGETAASGAAQNMAKYSLV